MTRPDIVNLFALPYDPLPSSRPMHGANTRGLELLETADGALGADVIWVPQGEAFPVHAHPSDHLLYCVGGEGTISIEGVAYRVQPGDLYLVPGHLPHAVGATNESAHILISIGAPHLKVDSPTRMQPVTWDGQPVEMPLASDGFVVCFRRPGCEGSMVGYLDAQHTRDVLTTADFGAIERHGPTCPRAEVREYVLEAAVARAGL